MRERKGVECDFFCMPACVAVHWTRPTSRLQRWSGHFLTRPPPHLWRQCQPSRDLGAERTEWPRVLLAAGLAVRLSWTRGGGGARWESTAGCMDGPEEFAGTLPGFGNGAVWLPTAKKNFGVLEEPSCLEARACSWSFLWEKQGAGAAASQGGVCVRRDLSHSRQFCGPAPRPRPQEQELEETPRA